MTIKEQVLKYPRAWEKEYRCTRFVGVWRRAYSGMFADHRGSANLGTLDLFAQYALMYLLRRKEGLHSLTWYKLAGNKDLSRIRPQIQQRWDKMRVVMGSTGLCVFRLLFVGEGFAVSRVSRICSVGTPRQVLGFLQKPKAETD